MGSSHSTPNGSPTFRESQVIMGVGPSPRAASSARPELSRTGVIKNSVNVRRSSFRLSDDGQTVSFRFDASVETKFRIYFKCSEYLDEKKFPILASDFDVVESDKFPSGLDQKFSVRVPRECIEGIDEGQKLFPVVIETVPPEQGESASQITYIHIKNKKATAVRQKLRYGDRGYELHEIFGIEKQDEKSPTSTSFDDIQGTDCVICLAQPRDTTIIPCLHLCLCSQCAQVLSLNTRKCPVCRTPATGLLQIDRDLPPPSPVSPGRAAKLNQ
jgi:E3 ubiquitin-protein ligase MGRN1